MSKTEMSNFIFALVLFSELFTSFVLYTKFFLNDDTYSIFSTITAIGLRDLSGFISPYVFQKDSFLSIYY